MVKRIGQAALAAALLAVAVIAAAGVAVTRLETRQARGDGPNDPAAVEWANRQSAERDARWAADGVSFPPLHPTTPGKSYTFPDENGVSVELDLSPPGWQGPLFLAVLAAALAAATLVLRRLLGDPAFLVAAGLALGLTGGVAFGQALPDGFVPNEVRLKRQLGRELSAVEYQRCREADAKEIAALRGTTPKAVPKEPCPSDLAAFAPAAGRAHARCSPAPAWRLVAGLRNGLLAQLPAPAQLLELVARHGDPVCKYVLDNVPLFRNDPAAWDAFALEPEAYCRVNAPPPSGPAAPAPGVSGREPSAADRKAWLDADQTRETFFGNSHPDGGPRMLFGLPGPMFIWIAGAVVVVCVIVHRRKQTLPEPD